MRQNRPAISGQNSLALTDGKRCSGSIPYGYNRLPGDKQTLVVDPVAPKVVKHIFALAADGYNPPTIAKKLTEEEVLIPSAYTLQYHPEQCNRKSEWGCTRWNPTTVREILERQEYLGHTVLRKTIGTNFKTDARRFSTDEEKLIFKDTHEPIIEEPVWTRVQKELKCHKYSPDRGKYQLTCRLPGLVYCADCGRVMGYNIRHNVNSDCYFYRCSTYSGYQTTQHRACTAHIISDDVLCELVLHSIQRMAKHIVADEKAFAMELRKRWQEQVASKPQEQKEELSRAKRRLEELDRLIGGLYENYMTGTLPEKQYRSLILWSKRCKDPALRGTVRETIHQVSHSKKWASNIPLKDEQGQPVLRSNGKPKYRPSYSILQDELVAHMQEHGFTNFQRGELGSTRENLTSLQYQIEKDKERLANIQERVEAAQTKYEAAWNVRKTESEIDDMGKKTITGKYAVSKEDYKQLTALAKEGITSRQEIHKLNEDISLYKKQYIDCKYELRDTQSAYAALRRRCEPFLQALKYFPQFAKGFAEKIADLLEHREAQQKKEREEAKRNPHRSSVRRQDDQDLER